MKQRDRSTRLRNVLTWRFCGFLLLVTSLLFTLTSIFRQPATSINLLNNSSKRFTVLINTWKRYDLLKKSVSHYASCSGVEAVRVVWSESQAPSEALVTALIKSSRSSSKSIKQVGFRIDMNDSDDLNNRFKPLDGVLTEAIFSVDDDILVPCSALDFAFRVWLSAPDSMVGFVPRMHLASTKEHNSLKYISHTHVRPESLSYSYGGWWSVWWTGTYSMVLTKAAFLHHKYLQHYTLQMPASIRQYVADERNCEDIAMSFMVANLTNAPPIWVKGKLYETGSSGISSLKSHNHHRTGCLNRFTSLYGYMPLVPSKVKAVNADSQWLW